MGCCFKRGPLCLFVRTQRTKTISYAYLFFKLMVSAGSTI
jgi:hypothetical protein